MNFNLNAICQGERSEYKFNVEEFGSQSSYETAVDPFFKDPASSWLIILVPPKWHKLLSFMRFNLQSKTSDNTLKHVLIIAQLLRNAVSS